MQLPVNDRRGRELNNVKNAESGKSRGRREEARRNHREQQPHGCHLINHDGARILNAKIIPGAASGPDADQKGEHTRNPEQ